MFGYNKVMDTRSEDIRRLTEVLVREFKPHKVVIFGSRVYGTARSDSDLDVLVVLPFEGSPIAMMSSLLARAYTTMREPFAVDIHPRRPLIGGAAPDDVMREALERGVVVYECAA
jgi:predicted nucleotidyltransferase